MTSVERLIRELICVSVEEVLRDCMRANMDACSRDMNDVMEDLRMILHHEVIKRSYRTAELLAYAAITLVREEDSHGRWSDASDEDIAGAMIERLKARHGGT